MDILNYLIRKFGFKRYLEIGIEGGSCFESIVVENKHGVDPDETSVAPIKMTSDDFFRENKYKFDLIFIDGLHEAPQVFKDIINALETLNEGGMILCHDMLPTTKEAQIVPRQQDVWNGDCWKAFAQLRATRSDLAMATINTDYGLGFIMKGKQTLANISESELENLTYEAFCDNKNHWMNVISTEQFFQFCNGLGET